MSTRVPHRSFVSYIDKSREYYGAHGYEQAYAWAHNDEVPFAALSKPLSECTVGLLTTSSLFAEDRPADQPKGKAKAPEAWPTSPAPSRLFTDDLSWDKDATHTNDVESFLPIERLRSYVADGRIGAVADRFYSVPTDYSQRRTEKRDAPLIREWAAEDGIDVMVMVPL